MRTRLVALIEKSDIHPESRHRIGLPRELGGNEDPEPMPWPRVLLVEDGPDGVFLYRYTEDGRPAGDTWHMSIQEAKEQTEDEYDGLRSAWRSVPAEVHPDELVAFALAE